MTPRHTASTIDDAALDALYAERTAARTLYRGLSEYTDRVRTLADLTMRTDDRPLYQAIARDLASLLDAGTTAQAADDMQRQDSAEQRADQAEEIARIAHQCSNEAERQRVAAVQQLATVEATLAETRRRHRGACERVGQLLAVLGRVRNAQSLGDVLAVIAEHDGLSPAAARTHGRILDRADSTDARLGEQQREHDIALAVERRRTQAAADDASAQRHRAGRYRTAWIAARRDRRADRAAMAADLATMQAAEQQLATVRAALPDEPRPRLGLPNDLAYANGRHDLAERVRYVLDAQDDTTKEHSA